MSDKKVVVIQPGEYPVVPEKRTQTLKKVLRNPATVKAAEKVLEKSSTILRDGVLASLPRLEAAGLDASKVYQASHEIRGLAGNANLPAAAKIASLLCGYLDAIMRAGKEPDAAVVRLHIASIGHAARATDQASILGEQVTRELSALVDRKLAEIA